MKFVCLFVRLCVGVGVGVGVVTRWLRARLLLSDGSAVVRLMPGVVVTIRLLCCLCWLVR